MSGGCSLALKISVTFCERVKRRRKREKNPFLETHVRAGRGRRSPTLKSQDWSPACSCLGSTASLKDALIGMPGQRYSGIWVFEVFSCIWYPKSSLQPGWWADQDEMLLCNKPQAEFLLLWHCECHLSSTRDKTWCLGRCCWRLVQVRIIQRITCSWLPIPEETSVVSASLLIWLNPVAVWLGEFEMGAQKKQWAPRIYWGWGTHGADASPLTGLPVPGRANTTLFAGALKT